MARLTPFLGICLALIVALTSGAMAVARGQNAAAGSIVICAGTGPVSVRIDADGRPVGPAHICPDCALHLMDAAAPPVSEVVAPANRPAALAPDAPVTAAASRTDTPRARAPPSV
ncbi:MAG: hypothetical protein QNJ44_14045 [Rhodobacter sp.]|nr:hypothetical protein [Rhodobacter sp.]